MPKEKGVESLKASCLQNVALNMDKLWCKPFLEQYFNQAHWLHVLGPFDELPFELCHDIFMTMREKRLLRRHHVYLLIHPYFKNLNCSRETNELPLILSLVASRCNALEALDLSWCSKLPRTSFLSEFPLVARNLVHLDVSHTSASDQLLSAIGVYGDKLQSLNLAYTAISGSGFSTLFLPQGLNGESDPRFGKATQLKKLNVHHCHLDWEVVGEALLQLRALRELVYENSTRAIYHVKQSHPEVEFPFALLHSSDVDLPNDALEVALHACGHNLQCLYLSTFENMNASSLLPLEESTPSSCDLKELHITNEDNVNRLSMVDALTLVLLRHGPTLVSLNLAEVKDICIPLIASTCSNLAHLSLQYNVDYITDPSAQGSRTALSKLQTLKILCHTREGFEYDQVIHPGAMDLAMLLGSKHITALTLACLDTLDDPLWTSVWADNDFPCIQSLILSACNRISFPTLHPLLVGHNPLRAVKLSGCKEITLRDFHSYQKYLRRRNLLHTLQLEWV